MTTAIKNGKMVLPDCSGFIGEDILIEDGVIRALGKIERADTVIDAGGKYVLPGLIDIHTHGSLGMAYAHGGYYELGKKIGSFGFSVKKK